MANTVKSKFARLLGGLWRRNENLDAEETRPVASAQPQPVPHTRPAEPAQPAAAPAAAAAAAADANEVAIPVLPVIAALPMDLRAKLMPVPLEGVQLRLPVETVLAQLPFGAVKISFGELCEFLPGVFANAGGQNEIRPVNIPLGEILPRLNPALLSRRDTPRVEVSPDITGPFNERGQGLSFADELLKPATSAAPVSKAANAALNPVRPSPPIRAAGLHPTFPDTPGAPLQAPRPIAAAAPPLKPLTPQLQPQPAPGISAPPPAPAAAARPVPVAPAPSAPIPMPTMASTPPPAAPAPTVLLSFADLSENWPNDIRGEIAGMGLNNASVALPGADIEPGLKIGRVTLQWKKIRLAARPHSVPSPNDDLELVLPLQAVAPAFFGCRKQPAQQRAKSAVTVSPSIPDLFFGFPQPAAPHTSRVSATPVSHETTLLQKAAQATTADTNIYVKTPEVTEPAPAPATDFLSRHMQPKDVVAKAAALPGVAGALVSLSDGLRVASEVPADFNAETLAAFLPQIFDRMGQSTRELRMGALNNVSFTVGAVAWKIFRVNAVFFAAFSHPGKPLPTLELATLATELDRKKNH